MKALLLRPCAGIDLPTLDETTFTFSGHLRRLSITSINFVGQFRGRASMRYWVLCSLILSCVFGGLETASATSTTPPPAPSAAARETAVWILASGDHGSRPFAIVDKSAALMSLYDADGKVKGTSSVLIGRVKGDHSVPGVGERTQAGRLRPEDATTPAGRFNSTPGLNVTGESVVWVEPETAFAIHRLRPGTGHVDRARRLAAADPALKRVSAGCVVVPVAFYESHVHPVLGRQPGVVYVLPERVVAADLVSPNL